MSAIKLDDFTRGYLEVAKWLLDENIDRNEVKGWSRDATAIARRDCLNFQAQNKNDLERYYTEGTWYDGYSPQECAGHDFFLTRNRHGAGFWDRGLGALGDKLAVAAHTFGETDVYMYQGKLYF